MSVPEDLLKEARGAINRAYAPYSGYRVASAVRAGSGAIYSGVNIENASYGLSMCAERVAIFKAVSSGERKVREVLVMVERGEPAPPCGACLQVIAEFGDDDTIVYSISNEGNKLKVWRLSELLPHRFSKEFLGIKEGQK
ncbi:cytidine deaminase [Acidilobus sp.]|jgi:cytidine deaminase|uniref:cytidine deaminase n=1 Tax=Acidilobus sp. TaxID=1872109 RepID=UPI003CFF6404